MSILYKQQQLYKSLIKKGSLKKRSNIYFKPKAGSKVSDIQSLMTHDDKWSQEYKVQFLMYINKIEEIIAKDDRLPLDMPLKLLFQTQINAIPISDINRNVTALGLYGAASYINHSCEPNTVHSFDEKFGTINFYAIKDIKQGEEITYTYIDLYQSKAKRAEVLYSKYFIENCVCKRCNNKKNST